ncbi:hypothetical protein [Terracidiphilus sp.]|jgi:hypothetical protein|uniref:hypothetical protein n=1 Tax=Terracidiphilus sp. TaxID=1964191 RepID=UPI003C2780D7
MNFRGWHPFKLQIFCDTVFSLTAVAVIAQHHSDTSTYNPGVQPVTNAPGLPAWYPESFFSTIQRR